MAAKEKGNKKYTKKHPGDLTITRSNISREKNIFKHEIKVSLKSGIEKLVNWDYFRRYTYNKRISYYSTKIKDSNELMAMVLNDKAKSKNRIDKDKEYELKKKLGLI